MENDFLTDQLVKTNKYNINTLKTLVPYDKIVAAWHVKCTK